MSKRRQPRDEAAASYAPVLNTALQATTSSVQAMHQAIAGKTFDIVLALARVMSGGDVAEGTLLPPRHLLDLERETFLGLLGERLTRDRIRHILKTGRPLRN